MVSSVKRSVLLSGLVLAIFPAIAQTALDTARHEIAFVSDTQAPMLVEKLFLKSHHNTRATQFLFDAIDQKLPLALFILGDVVAVGHREKKWRNMDLYLQALRKKDVPVFALLGNHDVMGGASKGQLRFNKRFPEHQSTGYYRVIDSVAVVLLNSNFKTLSAEQETKQQQFYSQALRLLDEDPAVKFVIVTCHHAPYSNSTLVGSSLTVQNKFVPQYIKSKKARLFVTGHAHAFERFQLQGKDFLTIGGGGGLHQPLRSGKSRLLNEAGEYNPEFHYLTVRRKQNALLVTSYQLVTDLSHTVEGYQFTVCCSQ